MHHVSHIKHVDNMRCLAHFDCQHCEFDTSGKCTNFCIQSCTIFRLPEDNYMWPRDSLPYALWKQIYSNLISSMSQISDRSRTFSLYAVVMLRIYTDGPVLPNTLL